MPARLALAAFRIPWKDLLRATPLIIEAASKLVGRWPRQPAARLTETTPSDEGARTLAELVRRLEALEASEASQAELASEMAKQLKEITEALRVVALRVLCAVAISALAVVVGLAALVRTFR